MVTVRKEQTEDIETVFNLIETSFKTATHSDQNEQFFVNRLRAIPEFIPELSLVAIVDSKIVGHIIFTKVEFGDSPALSLSCLAVLPEFQSSGVGTALIEKGHEIAANLGYSSVFVLGHETYYPRFGYKPTDGFNITSPFEVPAINYMVKELVPSVLDGFAGSPKYSSVYFEF